jgi:threonine dehydratase
MHPGPAELAALRLFVWSFHGTQYALGDFISPTELNAARNRISSLILHTPLVPSHAISERAGGTVHLKLECFQRTGSFKVRGALSKVSSLTPEQRQAGLICASSGRHGLGVAYASACFQTRCIVVLPENVNPHNSLCCRNSERS